MSSNQELWKSKRFTWSACIQEKIDAWPQTSPQLFQQKTENTEQSRVGRKGLKLEEVRVLRRMTRIFAYCLRFQSNVKETVALTSIVASNPNATAEISDGWLWSNLSNIGRR